jgi:subtilase family serine protease
VIANGNGHCTTPPFNAGWALESALDIEWAHVMAPSAKIYLVEACSNSYDDMFYAVRIAGQLVAAAGGGVVSNSWGSGEFAGQTTYDNVFRENWQRVTYVVSAGDSGLGAEYPSSSPWVVSAGGTTINRDASSNFQSESCWSGSGGGVSAIETWTDTFTGANMGPWAAFQYPQFGKSSRRTPDISFNADPASGAWVYSIDNGGWWIVGGTSLSAPALAGIINSANNRLGLAPTNGGFYSNMENNLLYAQLSEKTEYASNFYDVKTGSNGAAAVVGWDTCTGVGSPRGRRGK